MPMGNPMGYLMGGMGGFNLPRRQPSVGLGMNPMGGGFNPMMQGGSVSPPMNLSMGGGMNPMMGPSPMGQRRMNQGGQGSINPMRGRGQLY